MDRDEFGDPYLGVRKHMRFLEEYLRIVQVVLTAPPADVRLQWRLIVYTEVLTAAVFVVKELTEAERGHTVIGPRDAAEMLPTAEEVLSWFPTQEDLNRAVAVGRKPALAILPRPAAFAVTELLRQYATKATAHG